MRNLDRQHLRKIAQDVVQQATSDGVFSNQLRSDPVGTLVSAGLPEGAANEFMSTDLGMEPDVVGSMRDDDELLVHRLLAHLRRHDYSLNDACPGQREEPS